MGMDLKGKAVKNLRLPTVDYTGTPTQVVQAQEGDTNSRFFQFHLHFINAFGEALFALAGGLLRFAAGEKGQAGDAAEHAQQYTR